MLHGGGEAKTRSDLVIAPHTHVGESASARNEFLTDLLMAKVELEQTPRTEMIRCPGLSPLPLSANPTAEQISIIGIPAQPGKVKIIKAVTEIAS